jgi:uncharacterized membrane protein YedE/YeeE
MFPLSSYIDFSVQDWLLTAAAIGVGFGFLLERAGFGSARKLTAVFYLTDMAVVKVMFTAIVTAMVGVYVLAAAGWLDLDEIYLVPTNYAAQFVGGLVFGAGFIVGGYCPGTAVAAGATGRIDGMVFILGIVAGIGVYAELMTGVDAWIRNTNQGEMTLATLTGLPSGVFVALFVLALAGTVVLVRAVENRFGKAAA